MRDKGAPSAANRPRLSPKSPNDMRADYFAPPGADRATPAWSPFAPPDGDITPADENRASKAGVASAGRTPSTHHDAHGGVGSLSGADHGTNGDGAQTGDSASREGWAASAAPAFTLSPSSTAFNAKFNHLLRGPSSSAGPGTPLHAPAASPFFPSSTTTPATTSASPASTNPFDPAASSASTPASSVSSGYPVPPTPGPSTTAGFPFPSSSAFAFPTSLPAARTVAGRPSTLASRASTASTPAANAARYTVYNPQMLFSVVLASAPLDQPPDPPPLLLLDIRTHTAYLSERITGSISICVPSTLLRRPAFGIDRVAEGLPAGDQAVFEKWASSAAIVVIDTESTSLVEGGGIASLLGKFDKAGFAGKLGWVKGGWCAVRTQLRALAPHEQELLLETGSGGGSASAPTTTTSTPFAAPHAPQRSAGLASAASSPMGSKKHARPVLQVRDLPISAFQFASTSAYLHESGRGGNAGGSASGQSGLPTSRRGVDTGATSPTTSEGSMSSLASQRPDVGKRRKSSNEPGNRNQLRTSANPFFDNIRQNSEALSLERSLAHLSPVDLPTISPSLLPDLPPYLRSLVSLSPMSRADRLARQFYELEVAERERLEGTFRYHAQQTALATNEAGKERQRAQGGSEKGDDDGAERWAKFGISAGVELGNLNRFKNIFPYEHSRVHLTRHSPSATDYVNASHLYLRNSSKRFIASQGPLPTTFRDFWQMCEQESVGVIIMLTNLHEAGREKCGRYWVTQRDGEWDVQVDGDSAHEEEDRARQKAEAASAASGPGGGFFNAFDAKADKPDEPVVQDSTVRRTITVQRRSRGAAGASAPSRARKIRHIQYRAWPDFDIPAEPADVVSLVDEVDAAQREHMREIGWNPAEHGGLEPPILAHCSAGVGRTGVFIMVSSLLAQLRRRQTVAGSPADVDRMEIDGGSGAGGGATQARPPLVERVSDPETSNLSTGLSLSSLEGPERSPGAPAHPTLPSLDVPALEQADPVFAGVNELREQRMSMVANFRQYVCVFECVLEGAVRQLEAERGRRSEAAH